MSDPIGYNGSYVDEEAVKTLIEDGRKPLNENWQPGHLNVAVSQKRHPEMYDPLTGQTNRGPVLIPQFTIKDSGKRTEFDSGMVRDTEEGKIDYTLILDGPMFKRWALHLTKGALKYAARNWMKAAGTSELERARRSAFRHFIQWFTGEVDEDHAAAVMFNINQVEYIKERLKESQAA